MHDGDDDDDDSENTRIIVFTIIVILPRDAMLARYICRSRVSVCLSATSRCSTETAKHAGSRKQRHTIA